MVYRQVRRDRCAHRADGRAPHPGGIVRARFEKGGSTPVEIFKSVEVRPEGRRIKSPSLAIDVTDAEISASSRIGVTRCSVFTSVHDCSRTVQLGPVSAVNHHCSAA